MIEFRLRKVVNKPLHELAKLEEANTETRPLRKRE